MLQWQKKDTLVINAAKGEAGAWEAGEAISIQPGPQGNILKNKHTCTHTACSKIYILYKLL